MRIIARRKLREFWEKSEYKDSEQPLKAWFHDVKSMNWKNSAEVKEKYRNASIITNERVVFNIAGNKYRLIVAIKYEIKIVFIRFIGTHKQYDKVNPEKI